MIAHNDRSKAITAEDIIRRYNLEKLSSDRKSLKTLRDGLTKTNNSLEEFTINVLNSMKELQDQVDGNITTWFFNGEPTLENDPYIDWLEETDKANHLGDLYYDKNTGYCYRFTLENNMYKWIKLKDSDITEALALANSAQDTADSKRRVFYNEPIPPYDPGDIWLGDETSDLYRCQIGRVAPDTFHLSDWIIATKYTDDTTANNAIAQLNNYKEEVKDTYVTNTTFATSNSDIVAKVESFQKQIDKNAVVFTEEPTPPYKIGDVYIVGDRLYKCIVSKGKDDTYDKTDWKLDLDGNSYATKSELELTDKSIMIEVNKKVNSINYTKAEIIAKINDSSSEVKINADSINMNGVITANNYFIINRDGSAETNRGKIGGWIIDENRIYTESVSDDTYYVGLQSYETGAIASDTHVIDVSKGSKNVFRVLGDGSIYGSYLQLGEDGQLASLTVDGGAFFDDITVRDIAEFQKDTTFQSNIDVTYRTTTGSLISNGYAKIYGAMDVYGVATVNNTFYANQVYSNGGVRVGTNLYAHWIKSNSDNSTNITLNPDDSGYAYVRQGSNSSYRISTAGGNISSRSLKENIVEFTDEYKKAIDILKKIKIYNFDYKYNVKQNLEDNKNNFGFIIEEVEAIDDYSKFFKFEETKAILTSDKYLDECGANENPDDESIITYKRYDEENLIKYLLTVCKAQQEQIDDLNTRLSKLEK